MAPTERDTFSAICKVKPRVVDWPRIVAEVGVVSAGSGWLLGQLLAPAMVVAISPFSIIAAVILVLHTDRPGPNGLAFLVGRLIGLAAITTLFMQAPRLVGGFDRPMSPWVLITLGAVLLLLGVWVWARRDGMTDEPRWLSRISGITPVGAGVIGVLLVLTNPKMLAATAAAGLLIGTAGLGSAGAGGAVAYYSAVASSTVAVPILAYVAVGARADGHLTRLKEWMHRRSGLVTALILVAVGITLLYTGTRAL